MKTVRARRAAGAARGLRAAVRQQRIRRPLRDRRADRSHVRHAGVRRRRGQRRETAAISTSTTGSASTGSSISARRSRPTPSSSSRRRARPTRCRGCTSRSKRSRAPSTTRRPTSSSSTVGALLDLPAFVKFLAVQRASGEIDGFIGNWGMSNFYLYRFRDGRPAQLLPWDADHSFWALDDPIDHRLDTNVLVRRVMERAGAPPALSRDAGLHGAPDRRKPRPATAAAGSNAKPTGWPRSIAPRSRPTRWRRSRLPSSRATCAACAACSGRGRPTSSAPARAAARSRPRRSRARYPSLVEIAAARARYPANTGEVERCRSLWTALRAPDRLRGFDSS